MLSERGPDDECGITCQSPFRSQFRPVDGATGQFRHGIACHDRYPFHSILLACGGGVGEEFSEVATVRLGNFALVKELNIVSRRVMQGTQKVGVAGDFDASCG